MRGGPPLRGMFGFGYASPWALPHRDPIFPSCSYIMTGTSMQVKSVRQVIEPGGTPLRGGNSPRAIFKPIPLVARFPMLDNALYNPELRDTIERTIRDAGGSIERE